MKSSLLPRFLFLFILFITISASSIFAQSEEKPQFQAKIEDLETGRKIDNVIIEIYKNGALDNTIICNDGKLNTSLDYDNDYVIKIGTNESYITKIVEYDTREIPQDVIDKGNLSFTATISLFKNIEGLNTNAFKKPIAKIAYSELIDDMHYDEDYTRQVYGEQNKVVEEYKKLLAAEAKKEAAKQKEYERLMKIGLKSYTSKDYTEARSYYEQALELYPDDINALKKIKAIEEALKNQEAALALEAEKQKQANFDKKIKEADASISSQNYIEALALLNEANTIIPNSNITTGKINEVNELINQQKQLNANYLSKLQEGENALINKNYNGALALYKKASELKPKEIKPKEQITKIESILNNLEAYNSNIVKGDEKFSDKKYTESIKDYEKALLLVPGDENAKSKILAAKEQIALLNEENDKLASFDKYNKQGDNFYNAKDYDSAITSYNKALAIKNDPEIVIKIEDSKEKLISLNQNKNEEEQFKKLVKEGDELYNSKDLLNSKDKYTQALVIRSDDKAVKSKLSLINDLLAKQDASELENKSKLEKEALLVKEGNNAYNNENYEQAIVLYSEAKALNTINSSNIDDKIRNAEIEKDKQLKNQEAEIAAIAKQDGLKNEQELYISKADNYFKKGNYQTALNYYEKANEISSSDYVTNQINESNKNLSTKPEDNIVYTSIKEDSYEARLLKRLEDQKRGYKSSDEKVKIQEEEKIMKENINIINQQNDAVEISKIEQKTIENNQENIDVIKQQISEINENEENFQIIKENNNKLAVTKAEIEKSEIDNNDKNYEKNLKKLHVIENDYENSMEKMNSQEVKTRSENSEKLKKQYNNSIIDDNISENNLKIIEQKETIKENNKIINDENKVFIEEQELINKNYKDSLKTYSSSNDPTRVKNNQEIEKRKNEIINHELSMNEAEAQNRIDAENKLNSKEYNKPVYNNQFKSKLAKDYPEGKTETISEVKNENGEIIETITKIIIISGNTGSEYKKTESKWGVMYLKNGNHISKNTFDVETSVRKD